VACDRVTDCHARFSDKLTDNTYTDNTCLRDAGATCGQGRHAAGVQEELREAFFDSTTEDATSKLRNAMQEIDLNSDGGVSLNELLFVGLGRSESRLVRMAPMHAMVSRVYELARSYDLSRTRGNVTIKRTHGCTSCLLVLCSASRNDSRAFRYSILVQQWLRRSARVPRSRLDAERIPHFMLRGFRAFCAALQLSGSHPCARSCPGASTRLEQIVL